MLSTSARIRVRTSSFLRAAARHKSEAKLRSIRGAARTSYRPDTLSRLHTNIKLHDLRSMSRSLRPASRAPQAQCRQSMLRRRRPPTCGRRYRAPRSWPPSAKRRSKKLSPSTTTSLATPVWAMVLKAPHGPVFDTVGAFAYQQGSVVKIRLAQTLLNPVILCVCFASSLLGPHVVCGSPVAVFFSFSLFVDCVLV